MPPALIGIVAGIEMAIKLAPGVISVVTKAKDFIASLFGAGVITAAQQNALFARVDELARQAEAGEDPSWWTVEPDPIPVTPTATTTTTTVT
jgi:hypothetical protein